MNNPLYVQDYGKDYGPRPRQALCLASCRGNRQRGIKIWWPRWTPTATTLEVSAPSLSRCPFGTYTGWNYFNKNFFEDDQCTLAGSFIPFARTKQERINTGDPRLSIEERYSTKETYVAQFKKAADQLVERRFLLPDDAARLVSEAEGEAYGLRLKNAELSNAPRCPARCWRPYRAKSCSGALR